MGTELDAGMHRLGQVTRTHNNRITCYYISCNRPEGDLEFVKIVNRLIGEFEKADVTPL